jgi:hypothetical protein
MKIFINWFLFLSFVGAIAVLIWHRHELGNYLPSLPERGTMTGLQVIVFALAIAFTWVEVLKWWKHVKPFNCLKCMCGWSALILAFTFHVEFWYMYLPLGVFVGAVFGAIQMRWL